MIYLATDKHGYQAIKFVEDYILAHKIDYVNLGVKISAEDVKLEVMIPPLVKKVLEDKSNLGIISCGTGIGVEIGANKFSGIRACLVDNEKIAEWSRVYDNCNVLCLVGWDADQKKIDAILDVWFKAKYDGDKDRIKMFETFDTWR